jgi:hypothetical protein
VRALSTIERRAGKLATRVYVAALPARRRLATDDRRVLEDRILPAMAGDPGVRRVVVVGCNEASSWYPVAFGLAPGLRFETVDPDPHAARFGARRRHVIGRLESLADDPTRLGTYDAVILNGVFNYGTDDDAAKDAVLAAAHGLLRREALLLIGQREPVDSGRPDLKPELLDARSWRPAAIPGLGVAVHRTENANGHTFRAFRSAT